MSIFLDDLSVRRILGLFHSINQLVELILFKASHESVGKKSIGDDFLLGNILGDNNELFGGDDFSVVGFGGNSFSNSTTSIKFLKKSC